MPNGNLLFALIAIALGVMVLKSIQVTNHRRRQEVLKQKLHQSVGAYIEEDDSILNSTSRNIYEVDDNGDYVLDAQGKKVKARHNDTFMLNKDGGYQKGILDDDGNWTGKIGNKRISKQDELYQVKHGTGPRHIWYDDEGNLIRDRRIADTFNYNVQYWNNNKPMDNVTDETWGEAVKAILSLHGAGIPADTKWISLIYGLYSVGHNLIFKEDKKLFNEPALIFKEDAGNGRIILAIVLSNGQIKVPNSRGANINWEDVTLEEAVQVFQPQP